MFVRTISTVSKGYAWNSAGYSASLAAAAPNKIKAPEPDRSGAELG
jgi:hypothetical protein